MDKKQREWRKVAENAWILDGNYGKGFYVVCQFYPLLDEFETTIVRRKSYDKGDDEHLVMKGDYRKEFRALMPLGYKACLDYYCSFPIKDPLSTSKQFK